MWFALTYIQGNSASLIGAAATECISTMEGLQAILAPFEESKGKRMSFQKKVRFASMGSKIDPLLARLDRQRGVFQMALTVVSRFE